ncbi:MAG: cation-translocating P-type ATPase [Planctomycetia bacterium]|nr:cation-translocating P-type ATPase [Planctomycetia bacterium]
MLEAAPASEAPRGDSAPSPDWHTLAAEQVLARLGTVAGEGLAPGEAAARLARHGPNRLSEPVRVSAWMLLAGQFRNVLVILLLVAVALSAFLGHVLEAAVIAAIILLAVLLGFVQEFRAERSLEALRKLAAPRARVRRGGRDLDVPAVELVPGDILLLAAGDRVAADARLVEAAALAADEAPLTGESAPVEKDAAAVLPAATPVAERLNLVFSGTAVTLGRATAAVVATGMATEFGRIAGLLESVEPGQTPLQKNLDRVGRWLAAAALLLVLGVSALGVARGRPTLEMLVFGIALAVAVVPEALPAVVTISLAMGVKRMVKRNALMRRLPAVETLGSTTVIGSDKTGTLTRDEMTVRRVSAGGEVLEVTGAGYDRAGEFRRGGAVAAPGAAVRDLLAAAALCTDARVGPDGVSGDPTEAALVVAAAKAGLDAGGLKSAHPRVDEIPFTSEARRMTTIHRSGEDTFAVTKGAPEAVLPVCAMAEEERQAALAQAGAMAKDALRVLAVARRDGADRDGVSEGMTFLGLAGMIDPPRPEAKDAVARCREAGIRVVMITGDHPATAEAIARELGILRDGRVATGAELDTLDEAALASAIAGIDVFARVSPAHKLRAVEAFQRRGHVVAMTGDGVNDAPALKKADIGIAMGVAGTEVSREAAAMTLTDDNFASIVAAVEEGRAIFGNIRKYLMYLLSSNIGEIGLMTGAAVAGVPLPLTAVQILYVNLATDGLPALALALDPHEDDLMKRPPRDPRTGIFTPQVVALLFAGGLWSTAVNLGLFLWSYRAGGTLEHAMTMTFVSLVLIQFLKAYSFRSDHLSVFRRPFANRWLNLAIAWEIGLLLLILGVPFLRTTFETVPLSWRDWLVVVAMAATVVPVLEIAKRLLNAARAAPGA